MLFDSYGVTLRLARLTWDLAGLLAVSQNAATRRETAITGLDSFTCQLTAPPQATGQWTKTLTVILSSAACNQPPQPEVPFSRR